MTKPTLIFRALISVVGALSLAGCSTVTAPDNAETSGEPNQTATELTSQDASSLCNDVFASSTALVLTGERDSSYLLSSDNARQEVLLAPGCIDFTSFKRGTQSPQGYLEQNVDCGIHFNNPEIQQRWNDSHGLRQDEFLSCFCYYNDELKQRICRAMIGPGQLDNLDFYSRLSP